LVSPIWSGKSAAPEARSDGWDGTAMSDVITDYHAKLFAHELNKRHSVADAEKLAGTLLDA